MAADQPAGLSRRESRTGYTPRRLVLVLSGLPEREADRAGDANEDERPDDRVRARQRLTGLGVEDDAHKGETVKHRSRVAKDPTQPNLRQVHLLARRRHAVRAM